MECAAIPSSNKPSSNISDFVSRFARVCRLRSVGIFSSENNPLHHQNPKANNNAILVEDGSSDATEETDWDGEKIHPQPTDEVLLPKSNDFVVAEEILKIFDTVSALKVAYVQLQDAHIPHDPDKIRAADGLVFAHLRVLCKIKRAYKEKRFKKAQVESKRCEVLLAEIQVQEKLLENLKSQAKAKDSDILCLRRQLQELDVKNAVLDEKLGQKDIEKANVWVSLCNSSFQDVAQAVSKSVHDFAKPLISLMKASGWDLNLAANAVEGSVVYSQRSHKKYAFEAYIARRMFCGITLQSYDVDAIMRFDDPIDALIEVPNSCFAKFCQKKYLLVVHPKMEASFFGNLDHRTFVASGKHPRTLFYQAFVKMAKWVWVLQGIAGSIDPKAEVFGVRRGTEFSHVYMESVVEEAWKAPLKYGEVGQAGFKVEFTVLPGFKIGDTLVKSRVYVSKLQP